MHSTIQKYKDIISSIKRKIEEQNIHTTPKIIAVSKTFKLEKILPLIEYGHLDYGENKVQEAIEKWSEIKLKKQNIKLHLIGRLQTNKVKYAIKIFDYIHSVDSRKLLQKIADEQDKQNKKFNLSEISMGMSSDYLKAVENSSTYLRIGSSIFGQRSK